MIETILSFVPGILIAISFSSILDAYREFKWEEENDYYNNL